LEVLLLIINRGVTLNLITVNENFNLPLLKEVEVRDSQKEGGAPGGKRSKNPGAAMKKYKTPGQRREKTQGQKVY
jgi:hypothetical protein